MNNNQESNVPGRHTHTSYSHTRVHADSFSLSLDTLKNEWWPVAEASLVHHVCTSCGTWWPHISFTHTDLRKRLSSADHSHLCYSTTELFQREAKDGNRFKPFETEQLPNSELKILKSQCFSPSSARLLSRLHICLFLISHSNLLPLFSNCTPQMSDRVRWRTGVGKYTELSELREASVALISLSAQRFLSLHSHWKRERKKERREGQWRREVRLLTAFPYKER